MVVGSVVDVEAVVVVGSAVRCKFCVVSERGAVVVGRGCCCLCCGALFRCS